MKITAHHVLKALGRGSEPAEWADSPYGGQEIAHQFVLRLNKTGLSVQKLRSDAKIPPPRPNNALFAMPYSFRRPTDDEAESIAQAINAWQSSGCCGTAAVEAELQKLLDYRVRPTRHWISVKLGGIARWIQDGAGDEEIVSRLVGRYHSPPYTIVVDDLDAWDLVWQARRAT